MLRNYFNTAIRTLWKHKLFSFINIFGLSLGITVAMLISLYVHHELSVDKWIPESSQVYRAYRSWADTPTGWAYTPKPLSSTLLEGLPEVEAATYLLTDNDLLLRSSQSHHYVSSLAYVDSTFFEVVNIPLEQGDAASALRLPGSVVISDRLAELLFGTVDVVGETVRFNDEMDLQITGVFRAFDGSTHLDFEAMMQLPYEMDQWLNFSFETYLKLHPDSDVAQVEQKAYELVEPLLLQAYKEGNLEVSKDELSRWSLQPFHDIYLNSSDINAPTVQLGSYKYLYIFGVIALLVLLIAGINYINLSTARASSRAAEIGVRKVSGADKKHLVFQFLGESVLQCMLALLLALPLIEMALPVFEKITSRSLAFFQGPWFYFLLPAVGGAMLLGLIAGIYPAMVLSAYQPVKVLKGINMKGEKGHYLRHALVVTQFVGVVVLAIMMVVIYQQVSYMLEQDLGFEDEQVVRIPLNFDDSWPAVEVRKQKWIEKQGIKAVTTASVLPGERLGNITIEVDGRPEKYISPDVIYADPDYDDVLGLQMKQGRFLSYEHAADTTVNFVVNEAFLKEFEITPPYLGKRVRFPWLQNWGEIIGVVENYHQSGLDQQIRPLAISGSPALRMRMGVLVELEHWPETAQFLADEMKAIEPAHPFRHLFLDQRFAKQYDRYQQLGKTLLYSTLLTILVAVLGLLGLAIYLSQQKTKEIGIRKILGASELQLMNLLLKRFVLLVLLSSILALPIGWWLARQWLQDFAYRMELSGLPFVGAIGLALAVTLLTVSWQALRAARRNPVKALRQE
jgi:putative ABC transport system permease protein